VTKREEREIAAVAVLTDRRLWEEPTPTTTKSVGFFFVPYIFSLH
jgi:hypothetical protein